MRKYLPDIPSFFDSNALPCRPTVFKVVFWRTYFLPFLLKIGSPKFYRRLIDFVPWRTLHELRNMSDIMYKTSVEIYESKKAALAAGDEAVSQQIGQGKDILSILSAHFLSFLVISLKPKGDSESQYGSF